MGGGTGTGAAPVIAKQAKEMDILTVGIVTMPFLFEGKMRCQQAQLGIEKLRNNVDSLIVINNNKLREVYGNLGFKAGFSKADEVLSTAARGIAEVITHHYTQNIDLRDAKTVLSNSGTAIMGSAIATGSARANEAIMKALDSPLLNDNKIAGAKNVLLLIVSGSQEITIDEIGEINDHIQIEAGHGANIIMGVGEDEELGESIAVTVIATGFDIDQQDHIVNTESKKIIHTLEEGQKAQHDLTPKPIVHQLVDDTEVFEEPIKKHVLVEDVGEVEEVEPLGMDLIPTTNYIKNFNVFYDEVIEEVVKSEIREEDFIIIETTPALSNIEVDAEIEVPQTAEEDQFAISFDMPLSGKEEAEEESEHTVTFTLEEEEDNDLPTNDPAEVIPVLEYNKNGETRYSLDDYMESENEVTEAKAKVAEEDDTIVEEELIFEKKILEEAVESEEPANEAAPEKIDPMESPIEALLRDRADERRKKLKDFNYKFQNNINSIEEIEREPAYKRQGIDLDETPTENKVSRTTLGEDSNDEVQLRSNNSFLHDNVD